MARHSKAAEPALEGVAASEMRAGDVIVFKRQHFRATKVERDGLHVWVARVWRKSAKLEISFPPMAFYHSDPVTIKQRKARITL